MAKRTKLPVFRQPKNRHWPYKSRAMTRDDFNRLVSAYYLDAEMSDGPFYGPAMNYDYLLAAAYVSGSQILNRGLVIGTKATIYRNAIGFDGVNDFADTGYVLGANDYREMCCSFTTTSGANLHGCADSTSVRRSFGVYNGKFTIGYVTSNAATAPLGSTCTAGKLYCVGFGGGKLWVDGALDVDKSSLTGAMPSNNQFTGAKNWSFGGALDFVNGKVYRDRIWTYTDIATATGDTTADLAAGLCTLTADWRMRAQDITLGPDSIIDDNGGTYTIAAAEITGANLLDSVNSIYDVELPDSVSAVVEEPVGTATSTIADGVSFTMEATIACAGGVATHTAEVIAGFATDTVSEWMGFTVTSGNKINAVISDGTTSTVIYGPVNLPTTATAYKMEYDSVAQTVTVSIDGVAETPVAYTDSPVFTAGGEHGTLLGLSGVVYTRLKDPLITVTRFAEDS